ncbi:MAG: molybdopterin-binding protein [Eubacteriales bacterium]|nr:molybdopterin-binding protein [Eubacteriales bacterium]
MGKVKAVCISEKKGVQKRNIGEAVFIEDYGIENDAHAGKWHRQVSLLSADKIQEFKEKGAVLKDGDFGENLIVEGFDFRNLPVGTVFQCNDVILEMTQIGKECHSHCEIYKIMGDCIMPREGVFAKVIHGGTIRVGDDMRIISQNFRYRTAVITLSDKGAAGEREDKSGPAIRDIVEKGPYIVTEQHIIPDEPEMLKKLLIKLCDSKKVSLILTTGGTGFSKRDWTPEATLAVADRNAPGIAEGIRAYSMTITPKAMLSRGVSVIRGETLIINLPGSPKAVRESMEYLMPALEHGLDILTGRDSECGGK